MKAVILAGGRGTRLASLKLGVPKPLAPIGQRPFICFVLDKLAGIPFIDEVVLSIGHQAAAFEPLLAEANWPFVLSSFVETTPLGTGGALAALYEARDWQEPVLVLNGDTLVGADIGAFIQWADAQTASLSLLASKQPNCSRYGRLLLSGENVVGFQEKGVSEAGYINAGVYYMSAQRLRDAGIPAPFSFETEILKDIERNHPKAFCYTGDFIDIGIPDDYRTFCASEVNRERVSDG